MANYAIGDLHANITELKKLLFVLSPKKEDTIIFLGDLIDKGVETKETIVFLGELAERHHVRFIKGNHEYIWERYLIFGEFERQDFLLNYGGVSALNGFTHEAQAVIEKNDIETIKSWLKDYLSLIERSTDSMVVGEYLLLHAGIFPEQIMQDPLVFTEKNYFLRARDMDTSRKYLGRYQVVSGHSHMGIEPFVDIGYINIDLGAAYGGYLGALHLEEKKVYRSDGKIFNLKA